MARMKLSDLKKVVEAIEANKFTEDPAVDFWLSARYLPAAPKGGLPLVDFEIDYATFLAKPTDDRVDVKGTHEIGDFCLPLKVLPK